MYYHYMALFSCCDDANLCNMYGDMISVPAGSVYPTKRGVFHFLPWFWGISNDGQHSVWFFLILGRRFLVFILFHCLFFANSERILSVLVVCLYLVIMFSMRHVLTMWLNSSNSGLVTEILLYQSIKWVCVPKSLIKWVSSVYSNGRWV